MSSDPRDQSTSRAAERGGSDELLIFLHIPKTAGGSFLAFLKEQYGTEEVVRIDPFRRSDATLKQMRRRFREAERSGVEVIVGHFPFGVHEWLEAPCRYVTFLRQPVDRVLSHYHFVIERPDNPQHEILTSIPGGLAGALAHRKARGLKNLQTRLIAGLPQPNVTRKGDPPDDEVLDMARANLDRFAVVGLTDRYDDSLAVMRRSFGWAEPVGVKRRNPSHTRPAVEATPDDLVELIEEHNRLDVELYAYAHTLFDRAWAEADRQQAMPPPTLRQAPHRRPRWVSEARRRVRATVWRLRRMLGLQLRSRR